MVYGVLEYFAVAVQCEAMYGVWGGAGRRGVRWWWMLISRLPVRSTCPS